MADFSKETNERHKTFLSLCTPLRQLEVKRGLFELAQMWITKNGQTQDFYDPEDRQLYLNDDPEDRQLYLNDLTAKSMDTTPQALPADAPQNSPCYNLPLQMSDPLETEGSPKEAETRRNARSPTTIRGDESATFTAEEAASVSAGKCMTTPLVHHACDTTEETDVDTETGNLTPGPQMSVSQPHMSAGSWWRQRHQAQSAGDEDVTEEQYPGLEASLLSNHRLQNKQMRLMNRNPHRLPMLTHISPP
ncbi:hypothetical protein NDU88_003468 [Pleurodeles waltl]|uniref:Uncharacterized protein n=1 Tax=Pleurodeles waltl TaxID=8319 RepID=A0AAV7WSV0_PLEWA|nr:hypothetical protein NDU88_003468 [Pleurodeles waltl]